MSHATSGEGSCIVFTDEGDVIDGPGVEGDILRSTPFAVRATGSVGEVAERAKCTDTTMAMECDDEVGDIMESTIQHEYLMKIIGYNNLHAVKSAIKRKIELNFRSSKGITPLIHAIELGFDGIVKLLLDSGADPNFSDILSVGNDIYMWTPLLTIITVLKNIKYSHVRPNGHLTWEKGSNCFLMLLRAGADPNTLGHTRDNDTAELTEWTPLLLSAHYNLTECIDKLLEYRANIDFRDKNGISALTKAIERENMPSIEILLRKGIKVNCFDRLAASLKKIKVNWGTSQSDYWSSVVHDVKSGMGGVDIHSVVADGDHHMLERLIKEGANINQQEENGETALHYAIRTSYLDCIRVLVKNGADISIANKENLNSLQLATLQGCVATLALLVQEGADVNMKNETGDTPLHIAVYYEHEECLKFLLQNGACLNAVNMHGDTPLHLAVHNNIQHYIPLLLEKGADILIPNKKQMTPLHHAAHLGVDIFKLLLPEDINKKGCMGLTTIFAAAVSKHKECMQVLIDRSAELNMELADTKMTPLHVAALVGNEVAVDLLLQHGANVYARDIDAETPIHYCAYSGSAECMKLLLDHADSEYENSEEKTTPLHLAVSVGHTDCTRLLINSNCNIEARNEYRNTPLFEAVRMGNLDCIGLLLHDGANVYAPCEKMITPLEQAARCGAKYFALLTNHLSIDEKTSHDLSILHIAARAENSDCLKVALATNFNDINVQDNEGNTPLHLACAGNLSCIELLLNEGADINACNRKNRTPLHLCALLNKYESIQKLIDKGANLNAPDLAGNTPLHFAAERGNARSLQVLLENNASVFARNTDNNTPLMLVTKSGDQRCQDLLKPYYTAREEIKKPTENPQPTQKKIKNGFFKSVGVKLYSKCKSNKS